MDQLRRFWNQPTKAFRNSQLFFGAFTISFAVAGALYAVLPDYICNEFAKWDGRLGGSSAGFPGPQCRIWSALAAANVLTLSLMCYQLLRDIRRNAAVHAPLLFMKSMSAALFVVGWLGEHDRPFLLVAAAGDFFTGCGIWYFARAAWAELRARGDAEIVPALGPSATS